jgi:hypothetical protein
MHRTRPSPTHPKAVVDYLYGTSGGWRILFGLIFSFAGWGFCFVYFGVNEVNMAMFSTILV